jgi:hypothetical protein
MDRFRLPSEIPDEEWPDPEAFIQEAKDCVRAAQDHGLIIRAMGGLAIFLHSQDQRELWARLARLGSKVFTDIDYVAYGKHRVKMIDFFKDRGFMINQRMLYHYGKTRQIYYGQKIPMAEVFYDQLQMNHTVPFKNRLERDSPTIPPAELLLQKLQMVHMNEKDIKDAIVLLRAHEIGSDDKDRINKVPIANVLRKDWGFYHTASTNLVKIKSSLDAYDALTPADTELIAGRIDELLGYLDEQPKSLAWKSRAKVGTRLKWYEEVDDWDVM